MHASCEHLGLDIRFKSCVPFDAYLERVSTLHPESNFLNDRGTVKELSSSFQNGYIYIYIHIFVHDMYHIIRILHYDSLA